MAKLVRTLEAFPNSLFNEMWLLDNGLEFDISEYNDENSDISISSTSGDVGDQIYERMNKDPRFKDIELIALGSYFIRVKKVLAHSFMEEIEKIDLLTLKEGKRY